MEKTSIEPQSAELLSLIKSIALLTPEEFKIFFPTLDRICNEHACSQSHALCRVFEEYERMLLLWKSIGTYY